MPPSFCNKNDDRRYGLHRPWAWRTQVRSVNGGLPISVATRIVTTIVKGARQTINCGDPMGETR